jgi:hypothetical protein
VAGNSPFQGIVFCNFGTSKTVISIFVTTRQILVPHIILPHVIMITPTMFPVDKKTTSTNKTRPQHQQCITRSLVLFFLGGALTGPYPTLRFGGACGLGVGAFDQVSSSLGWVLYCISKVDGKTRTGCQL